MEKLDQRLLELFDDKNRKEKIKIHLDHLYSSIERKEIELLSLQDQLSKEERDVDKLEEKGLYTLFLTVLGTKEQQLEKERQEYLQAFMKVQGLEENLHILREEKAFLQKTYSGLQGVEKNFKQTLKRKIDDLIKKEDCPPQLVKFIEKISSYSIKIRELETCIKKGNIARKYLQKVSAGLQDLDSWGIQPSHKLSNKAKKIVDRVNKDAYIANNFLQKFEAELQELEDHFELDFRREISQFEIFIDQFVDALITDWIVKLKIFNSNNLIYSISDKSIQITEMLQYEIEKTQKYIEETQNDKANFILKRVR